MLISHFQRLRENAYAEGRGQRIGKVRAGRPAPLRVGATVDPESRAGRYANEKQKGGRGKKYSENATMHYAQTSNMKSAENRLLHICDNRGVCQRNVQMSSNVPASASEGYVYAIFP